MPNPTAKEQERKLIAVLKSQAPRKEKVDACLMLARIGTGDAVPTLAALLDNEELSHMARYALEPIPDAAVDEALRDALGRLHGRPLVGVIGSIGVRRDAKAAGSLARLLRDSDAEVARAAARALGKIGNADAAKALQEALPKVPAPLRPAVADGCLACAEAMLAVGKPAEAAAIYQAVGKADLPAHFRVAAMQGLILARQPAGTP